MRKRMVVMLVVMGIFAATMAITKVRQIQAAMAAGASYQPPPEAVTTVVAAESRWERSLEAIGTVTALHGVTVSADLPGVVETIAFESGRPVRAGDVLVRLDTRQEEAQLAAGLARLDLARANFARAEGLRAEGVIAEADYDAARAERAQAEASVGETRATIGRKTVRAPFSGVLGIRQVDLGQYLAGGAPIVALQALDPIYVDFTVPQQDLSQVRVGGAVGVEADGLPAAGLAGRVTAIDAVVDTATRNVRVRATLDNPGQVLRPGMFARARLIQPDAVAVVTIPASAIRYAPYGDMVFIVEQMQGKEGQSYRGVRQQVVRLGDARGDQIAILDGVRAGEEVVTSGVFKLRNGAAVLVNNEVRPGNNPKPEPEDA
jgi:membrane fusion protein (multidrug efflux system)